MHDDTPSGLAAAFREAYGAWRRMPLSRHVAAVALLGVILLLRWPGSFLATGPVHDEGVYLSAFERAARGESPYLDPYYYYTPTFAAAGGWAVERLGATAVLRTLRALNLLGGAVLAWCSFAWLPWTPRRRFAAAAVFLVLVPPVQFAVLWGNLSLAALGLLVLALTVWHRRPLVAGGLLALSLLIKPIGPLVGWCLLAHRPTEGGRRHVLAGLVGLGLAAGIVVATPFFADMLALSGGRPEATRSVSLHSLLYCFGVRVEASTLLVAVAAAGLVLVRRRPLPPAHFLALTATLTLWATPLVWSHTLLLALAVEVLALWVAWVRWRARPAGLRRYELVFVVLAVLAAQLSGGVGGVQTWAYWLQGLFKLLPCLAPALLTVYLVKTTEPF